jgi:predicted dehydrogenase
MPIPTIHVGCTNFGQGRLQALVNANDLEPVACVDLDVAGTKTTIASLTGEVPAGLGDRVYTSITEAHEQHDAQACLIFASTTAHSKLIVESLDLGLHTLCVKPVATTQDELRTILDAHREHPELMFVQGQNKRWNPAAVQMRDWLREEDGIGELLGGECRFWIRNILWTGPESRQPDAYVPGLFFHSGAAHQLDQLVAAKGLPKYVTAYVHTREEPELGHLGDWGTAGGQALMQYANGAPFTYTGSRATHAEQASGWSGTWSFHGEHGDLFRDAGHLRLFRKGECVEDLSLQDLHRGLIEDDRLQFDAFANALTTGQDRDWMQTSSLDTWILMEACNESARTQARVDIQLLRTTLL